jgi:glycine cleavage system aminomethyltransferase T
VGQLVYILRDIMPFAASKRNQGTDYQGAGSDTKLQDQRLMNKEWRAFLEQAGVIATTDSTANLGRLEKALAATLNDNMCYDLSHLGLIRVHGPDSATFLQGQLTCDVQLATPQHSLLGAYCSPKGRALACFRLFQRQQVYYLQLPHPLVEPTIARLRKYVLRAKVELHDASAELARLGVAGPQGLTLLTERLGYPSEMAVDTMYQIDGITLIRLPGLVPRFALHGPVTAMQVSP